MPITPSAFIMAFTFAGLTAGAGVPAHRIDLAGASAAQRHAARAAFAGRAIDYGSFLWIEGALPHDLAATPARRVEDAYTLRMAGQDFDPAAGPPQWEPGWGPDDLRHIPAGSLHLVQMRGPARTEWRRAIEDSGAEILQHIHPFTYVVWLPHDAPDLGAAQGVRATAPFAPACKVAPRHRDLPANLIDIRALIVQAAGVDQTLEAITGLGADVTAADILDHRFAIATLRAPASIMRQLAQLPGVYAAQPVPTDAGPRGEASCQVLASSQLAPMPSPGYQAFLAGIALDGAGVVIAHVDQGLADSHPVLAGAILPCAGPTCAGAAQSVHGTHTAGCIVGDATGNAKLAGFLRGQGVAPAAGLIEQTWVGNSTQPDGMLTLIEESKANGAVISTNSWGASATPQGYDIDTMLVDMGVRDADPALPGDQPVCYVLAIRNGFGGVSSLGSPDEAKNVIAVGSTYAEVASGGVVNLVDNVSNGSGHGPALDGRRVPHIVAPGCQVDGPSPPSTYTFLCGTSFAAPHVAGVAALVVQRYRQLFPDADDPSPALIKALLCGAAVSLQGMDDADGDTLGPPPDNAQGWGRASIPDAVDIQSMAILDQAVILNATGQEWATSVTPIDPNSPVRIMLAWTDAPGHGLGGTTPAWNNDLDLRVNVGADLFLGNNFNNQGLSVPGGAADPMNNIEAVVLDPPPASGFTITVRAADLNSDALPSAPSGTDQDFAVVCLNCAFEPAFTLSATPEALDLCAGDSAGVTIQTTPVLGFNEPITLSLTELPPGVDADIAPNPILPGDAALLTLTAAPDAAPGLFEPQLTAVAGDIARSLTIPLRLDAAPPPPVALLSPPNAQQAVPYKPTLAWQPTPQASSYTLELALDPQFNQPVTTLQTTLSAIKITSPLALAETYYWRITPANACAEGPTSQAFSFTVNDTPRILLVDDDDNAPDMRPAYQEVLDDLGQLYDTWNTANSDNEPSAGQLAPYDAVVWFTARESGGFAGPGPAGEAALTQFLNAGGCLLLSSQDYLNDRGVTPFMTGQLALASSTKDVTQFTVTGANLFDGIDTTELQYPFSNFSDRISPTAPSGLMFAGDDGDAAIGVITDDSAAVWLAFPLEAVPSLVTRSEIVQRVLDLCAPPPPLPCPGDLNADATVDSTDLNILLAAFASGPAGDLDNDADTDSADLNILLANFAGSCP